MIEFTILATIFWIPAIIVIFKNFLWDLYFWQLKEYMWERFWTHVRWDQSEENRSATLTGFKFVLFASLTLIFEAPTIAILGILLSFTLWTHETFEFIKLLISKKLRKPSLKSFRNLAVLILVVITFVTLIILFTLPFLVSDRASYGNIGNLVNALNSDNPNKHFPDVYVYLGLSSLLALFIDLASPIIISFFVFITSPLTILRREIAIYKAQKKFEKYKKNFTFIAVTGSQGKTTTKEVLYEVLKNHFKVAKTPENYNSDYGVANSILTQLKSDTEIFIAEVGAYRLGDIKKVVKKFPPDISIVTDVDVQHLGLFGSRRNLFEAKAEIIKYMNPNGVAVLNGDNEKCIEMLKYVPDKAIFVSSENDNQKELRSLDTNKIKLFEASKINFEENKTNFELKEEDSKNLTITVPQRGKHLINTFMIAFAVVKELGVYSKLIAEDLKNLKTKLPRLSLDTGDNGTLIINNTYNSSYKGLLAAVERMSEIYKENKLKGNKILITRGIYELGREKKNIYKKALEEIKSKIDILITSDSLLSKIAKENNTKLQIVHVKNHEEMIYETRTKTKEGDIILLEGRLNPNVIKELISDEF